MGLAVQAGDRLTEHLGVPLHVLFRGPRSDECHVVKRCHQDVTVEREEVHVSIQLLVYGRGGFRTVPWRLGPEPIFGAAAETFHDPGESEFSDNRLHACVKPLGQGYCLSIGVFVQNITQGRTHRRQRQSIAGKSPTYAAHIGGGIVHACLDTSSYLLGESVDCTGECHCLWACLERRSQGSDHRPWCIRRGRCRWYESRQ